MSKKDAELIKSLRKYADRTHKIGCFQASSYMHKAANRLDQLVREKEKDIAEKG